ncbi:IS66 family transposase [Rhizobium laguerreae]|uniref:IS66 family transposase n=1 Tax=Rhizobium laguerreae TaxID=1076926 RepID=UPI001C90B737|nr:IS66 family transposase [Rhizobium laguerreae]MBY3476179.1 IS66 family transposase [Rhizobium laguerreae]MBY3524292.1 IS66 family transposase [Rhizobium laguerreae]
MLDTADLPDDVAALKAMLIAAQAREAGKDAQIARKDERIERLEKLVAAFKQVAFGRKSEKTDPDQFDLALEDLETAMAAIHAEDEADVPAGNRVAKPRATNRGSLPQHLPRVEEVIEPESLVCACGGCLHCIGEDVSERLDVVPAQFRVIVTRRPKYACRTCSDGVVQAPAPARLIQAGLPTEATVAHVMVSKYADHLPLYRQAQIMSRQGIDLDRSTLADSVGRAAFELRPVFDALIADLKRSTKLFMDETRAPVLDPGSRKTKTGYFWALARDDRPWGGGAPPGVAFTYAPGRGGIHAERILQGFSGILQVDGYAGYNRLIAPDRVVPDIRLAYCWAHARRKLVEITRNGAAPIAEEGVRRIGELYRIEAELRGLDPQIRLAGRRERSAPLIAAMHGWLAHHRARVATKSPLGEALAYIAKYWDGLKLFLTDGRIEIDNNSVERTIRPIALNRKNALFAGHDAGAENWATIASLVETFKLNAVDPQMYLTATLTAIVNGHKQSRIDELLPWTYSGRTNG